jgi:anti-sigma B factor antagonist
MASIVPFRLSSVELGPRAATIGIEGELDMYTVPDLEAELRRLGDGVTHVLVDLRGVTFVDSAGIGLLTQRARRLAARGGVMMLAIDTMSVRRIFELTGLDRYFVIHEDASEAAQELLGSVLAGRTG